MSILAEIIEHKKTEVATSLPYKDAIIKKAQATATRPSFIEALKSKDVAVITEFKRASPSAGPIDLDANPEKVADAYAKAGATAISVLTDNKYFKGSMADLKAITSQSPLPILRKDFIIDEVQIYEAKAAGASAFLLIAAVLDSETIAKFIELGKSLNLDALVEVHNAEELEIALAAKPEIVGVNNRNLKTFETNIAVSLELAEAIKKADVQVMISESGIKTPEDIKTLSKAGYGAFLVGEAVMRDGLDALIPENL